MSKALSISIDVGEVERAAHFYERALGCERKVRHSARWLVLTMNGLDIHLQEQLAGTIGAANQERSYARHWTPIHLDFGVTDVQTEMGAVRRHGGTVEGYNADGSAEIAHCADPFGNGFCLIREPT